MDDSDDNYEDYHDDHAPQYTKILDLTNGEGGERRGAAGALPDDPPPPPPPPLANYTVDMDANTEEDDDEEDEEIAMAQAAPDQPQPKESDEDGGLKIGAGGEISLNPNTPGKVVASGMEQTGRWTKQEHEAFLEALRMYGKEWKKVAAKVKTRTVVQTRTHAQKYFQKLQKAQESAGASADVDYVDMGVGDLPTSAAKSSGRGPSSSTKKKQRASAVAMAGPLGPMPGPLSSLQKPNRRGSSATLSAAQVISNLSSSAQVSVPFGSVGPPSASRIPRQHGFSTDDAHPAPFSSSKPGGWASISTPAASMKIVAPDPLATMQKGNFPEPSPAATGKRKLAEIAAARMLAGVAGAVPPHSASKDVDSSPSMDPEESFKVTDDMLLDDRGDGAATPPLPDGEGGGLSMKNAPLPPLFGNGGGSSVGKGLSLQIVNPESLGVTHEKRRRTDGEGSPVTPWDGQLEALVNENEKTSTTLKSAPEIDIGGLPLTDFMITSNGASKERIEHRVCGQGSAFGRSKLHCAVCEMDIESLQNQLADTANQNSSLLSQLDNAGYAPLHTAASLRLANPHHAVAALEMVKTLLAAGADPNVHDEEGNGPLHWGARAGDRDVVEALLLRNSQLDAKNKMGETPLHWAMRAGYHGASVASMLVENGARISILSKRFKRPVDVAAEGFLDSETSIASLKDRDAGHGKKMSRELKKVLREKLKEIRETRFNLFARSNPSRSLVLHHPECLEHVTKSSSDWEAPDRVVSIMTRISQPSLSGGEEEVKDNEITLSSEFERASLDLLSRVHSTNYLQFVQNLSKDLEKQVKATGWTGLSGDKEGDAKPPVVPFTPMVQRSMIKVSESNVKSMANSDTAFSAGSLRAARRAAGAVQHAVDCVLVGRNRNAFCIVRPPGHHAGVSGLLDGGESCGFCIFNNVAAGALYAISDDRLLCERCAIVDIDVHHGNGTEEIVRKCSDPSKLFFFSIHLYDNEKRKRSGNQFQYKFYPGTGSEDDLAMNIINVPLVPLWKDTAPAAPATRTHNTRQKTRTSDQEEESPVGTPRGSARSSETGSESGTNNMPSPRNAKPGTGRLAYRDAIQNRLLPSLRAFNPDLILISAGFDAAKGDVGNARHERGRERIGLDLEPEDYAWTTRKILEIADICCNGRVVSVLEGGYGRSPLNPPVATAEEEAGSPLDRTIFSECAVRHLHAMIDPYDVERRFTPFH